MTVEERQEYIEEQKLVENSLVWRIAENLVVFAIGMIAVMTAIYMVHGIVVILHFLIPDWVQVVLWATVILAIAVGVWKRRTR